MVIFAFLGSMVVELAAMRVVQSSRDALQPLSNGFRLDGYTCRHENELSAL